MEEGDLVGDGEQPVLVLEVSGPVLGGTPNVVVFAQIFTALPSGDEKKSYIVAIGAAAKDDGVFEAKAKGVAPASVSALSPRRDDTPKWMLKKKALAQAATTVSDDEHR